MSIFASQTQRTIPIPFDAPHTVTIQKLTGQQFEAAQFAHMTGVLSGKGRNWATTFLRLASAGTAKEADAEKVLTDPLSGFDRASLVTFGVKGWSYLDADGTPKAIDAAAIADLDDEALEFFATEALRLTKPMLFVTTVAEAEGAIKNG